MDTKFLSDQPKDLGNWTPTETEDKNLSADTKHIEDMYEYRAHFEHKWDEGAAKWNFLAGETTDGTANYVVPISRMATNTGIVAMRQDLPEAGVNPAGLEDKLKADLIQDASAHVDRMTNMEQVMDQFIVDYAVLGNGVLEDYVKIPFKTERYPNHNKDGEFTGTYKELIRRDWSKTKIGTRSRSPWECAFDANARTPSQIRACTFRDELTYDQYVEEYKRRPKTGDHLDFINLDYVSAGSVYLLNEEGNMQREDRDDEKVVIEHYQNEIKDVYRIYANGVLIWDVSLSEIHKHGKITLTLVPNHHKYDRNGKTHALYGAGDPELLLDLDDLVNAATNMFIDNYKRKNSYIIGIEGAGIDIDEQDFIGGEVVKGKVNIQSLGAADLPEWQAFKETVEEWAIQMAKKNWKTLQGDASKTAYEMQQKLRNANMGMSYQIKKMEAGGLLEHMRKRISDIMQYMTEEEWMDIADEEEAGRISEMMGNELAAEDIRLDPKTRKPLQVRFQEKFRTRGKVYEEEFVKGKRTIESLSELPEHKGEDGMVTAAPEYLQTREFTLWGGVPDIYVVGKTMLGEDKFTELGRLERFIQIMFGLMQVKPDLKVNLDKILEKALETLELKKNEIMDVDNITDEEQEEDDMIDQMQQFIKSPNANAQPVPQEAIPSVGVPTGGEGPEGIPDPQQATDRFAS